MESKVGRDEALQRGTRGVIEAREGEDKAPGEMNCHSSEDVFDACTADRGGCKSEGRLVGREIGQTIVEHKPSLCVVEGVQQ